MRRISRTAAIVAVAAFATALLAGCTPDGNGIGSSKSSPVELGNYENAITVTPTLDTERAVTETIGFAGGSIRATAADGTVFTLAIPADSLRQVTRITMTPVARLGGLPFGNGTDVTVDLQPSGLVFDVPATLSIAPATPIPAGERLLYGYSDNRLVFAEPVLKAEGIAIVVTHFSGYGAARGLMGDVDEARKRIGGSAEERITSEMRAVMQAWAQGGPHELGQDITNLLEPYFEQLDREVIQPRLAAAGQSCAAGRSAILTVLGYARQRELLGYGDQPDVLNQVGKLLESTVGPKCMDEEYAMCVNEHIVHRIAPAYLGTARQLMLLGIENSPVFEKMERQVDGCLHFDLEFEVSTRYELDHRAVSGGYQSYAESTELSAEVAFSIDGALSSNTSYFEPSSGPMESLKPSYQFKWAEGMGCKQATALTTWSDTGHFLGMNLTTDPADLDKGGGGINAIEIELGLPSPTVKHADPMICEGHTFFPQEWKFTAPAIFKDIHGDTILRDWKIQGGQTPAGQALVTATTEWKALKQSTPAVSVEYVGTATLRHTPR